MRCPLETGSGEVCNGVIALEVDQSDTVGEVKSMIHERGGLSPEKQQLSFVGEALEDDRKLSSYKIGSNCLLEETSMWVSVRIQSSKSILVSINDQTETVRYFKARIQEKVGISKTVKTILYRKYGKQLEDERTLEKIRVLNGNRLYLRVPAGPPDHGSTEVLVDVTRAGKPITLYVEPSDMVEDLKYYVYEKMGIPPIQQKILVSTNQVIMEDHKPLSSYDIQHQLTVIKTFVPIKTRLLDRSEELLLQVQLSDTVGEVMTRIQEEVPGISADNYRLRFAGKVLSDSWSLSSYQVSKDSCLQCIKYTITLTIKTSAKESFQLRADGDGSVYSLKHSISIQKGIPIDQQVLLLGERKLRNDQFLEDYKIQNDSILQLSVDSVFHELECYKIYVAAEGDVTSFGVSSTSPIIILENMYRGMDLIFNSKKLQPDSPQEYYGIFSKRPDVHLGNYRIQRGHLIHAIPHECRQTITIYIRNSDHKQLACLKIVDCETTVLSLKVRLWSDIDLKLPPPSQQRLIHNDLLMEDNQMLDEIGVKDSDSIVVRTPQQVCVRCPNDCLEQVSVHYTDKVAVLKQLISKKTAISSDKQLLYYKGKIMDDECTINSYLLSTTGLIQLCKYGVCYC